MKITQFKSVAVSGLLAFGIPVLSQAQTGLAQKDATAGDFGALLTNILTFTNTTLIPFIIGIGFLFFVWGMFQYFIAGGANDEAKEKGKSLMIYATLGFVLIIIFWGVINLLASSTGLNEDFNDDLVPGVRVPGGGGGS
ncbi:MAG: hypothetical protein ACOC4E_01685 [Patescibacteria group bacterium]